MANTVFTVSLADNDWDSGKHAWRCPALDIPGASIQNIYVKGDAVDKLKYTVLDGPKAIKWIPDTHPSQAFAELRLGHELTLESDTKWWQRFGTVVPIIASIAGAAVGLLAHMFVASHQLHLETSTTVPSNVVLDGVSHALPTDYKVTKDATILFDPGDIIRTASEAHASEQAAQTALRIAKIQLTQQSAAISGVAMWLDNSIASLQNVRDWASSDACPGGAHGLPIQGGGSHAAMVATVLTNLENTKANFGVTSYIQKP